MAVLVGVAQLMMQFKGCNERREGDQTDRQRQDWKIRWMAEFHGASGNTL